MDVHMAPNKKGQIKYALQRIDRDNKEVVFPRLDLSLAKGFKKFSKKLQNPPKGQPSWLQAGSLTSKSQAQN